MPIKFKRINYDNNSNIKYFDDAFNNICRFIRIYHTLPRYSFSLYLWLIDFRQFSLNGHKLVSIKEINNFYTSIDSLTPEFINNVSYLYNYTVTYKSLPKLSHPLYPWVFNVIKKYKSNELLEGEKILLYAIPYFRRLALS
jgi:hypothetical protein